MTTKQVLNKSREGNIPEWLAHKILNPPTVRELIVIFMHGQWLSTIGGVRRGPFFSRSNAKTGFIALIQLNYTELSLNLFNPFLFHD